MTSSLRRRPDDWVAGGPNRRIAIFGQRPHDRIDLFAGEMFVEVGPDHEHGCVAAGAQTLGFEQRELAVRRRAAQLDSELFLQVVGELFGAHERAGDVAAHFELVFAALLTIEHRVEADHLGGHALRDLEQRRHFGEGGVIEITKLGLRVVQGRQHG
jgi:hypothetical protein